MSDKPIWSGEMRKAHGRFYLALNPVPNKFWTDHVLCEMAYEKDGKMTSEEVRLSADDWFAMEPAGNILADTVMAGRTPPSQNTEEP